MNINFTKMKSKDNVTSRNKKRCREIFLSPVITQNQGSTDPQRRHIFITNFFSTAKTINNFLSQKITLSSAKSSLALNRIQSNKSYSIKNISKIKNKKSATFRGEVRVSKVLPKQRKINSDRGTTSPIKRVPSENTKVNHHRVKSVVSVPKIPIHLQRKSVHFIKNPYFIDQGNNDDISGEKLYAHLLKHMKDKKKQKEKLEAKKEEKKLMQYLYDKYHPVKLHAKRGMLRSIDNLHRDIQLAYCEEPRTMEPQNFSDKFRRHSIVVDIDKDNKRKEMKQKFDLFVSGKDESLRNEVKNKISKIQNEEAQRKKVATIKKWKKSIISAAIHLKRLKLTMKKFLDLGLNKIKPYEHKGSEKLFKNIKEGNERVVIQLLESNPYLIYDFDHFHQTALHWIVKRNRYLLIPYALQKGALINFENYAGRTPLHVAAAMNNLESVMILLYEFANPFAKDNFGKTPADLTKSRDLTYIFNRVLLLYFFHSMKKIKVFEDNLRRGLRFLYSEMNLDFSEKKFGIAF